MELRGRTALVTGASRGIERELATRGMGSLGIPGFQRRKVDGTPAD